MKRFLERCLLGILLLIFSSGIANAEIMEGYDVFEKTRPIRLDNTGRIIGATYVLDPCEAITGWTALSNDTTGIAVDLDHVMGAQSLEWDKVDGGDNLTVGGIQKTITAVNLTFLIENAGAFGYSMNVSSVANLEYCFIRVGTSASHYNEWRIDDNAIRIGWNSFRFNINAPATDGTLGNGWNSSVVTYIALGCNHDLETDLLADVRVDHIVVHAGLQVAADVNANASSSGVGGTDVNISKVAGNATDVDSGTSGIGTIRVTNSTDDIVSVSDDDNANTATNPIYFQPTDGTAVNAVGNPIYSAVSKDTNTNTATNPIFFQPTDGTAVNAVGNPIYSAVSKDTNTNTATNPIFFQPTDGTAVNAVGNPIYTAISKDTNTNTATNPVFFQPTDGTAVNAQGNPIYAAVSKDTAANADTNRIFVKSDMDKVAGTATVVNGGNRSAGVQTTTLADDDPAVLAVAALAGAIIVDDAAFTPAVDSVTMAGFEFDDVAPDSVDEGDGGAARMSGNRNVYTTLRDASGNERGLDITATGGAEVDIATQTLTALAVSKDNNANATANRLWVTSDTDLVGGAAVNVNGGNRDGGTATVAIADDDPVAVSTAFLNTWDDGEERAKVNVEQHFTIDTMDATTGWAGANDASTGLALSANHVSGTGSLTFNKVNGTGFTEGYIEKTLSSVEFLHYQAHNLVEWSIYLSDLSDVEYVFIRLGDDNANYSEWRVGVLDLTAGVWNPIGMLVGNVEYTVVGTGLDSTDCDYVAVGVSFGLEDDLLNGIAFDEIHLHGTQHTTSTIAAEVTSTVNSANINVLRIGGIAVAKNSGNLSNGTLRVAVATDDVNQAAINASTAQITVEDLDTTGATENKQVVAIMTQSATGAQLNSATYPLYTSSTGGASSLAALGPTATDGTPDLVLAAQDISQAASWGFHVWNDGGGGNPLTDADIQVSRDGGTTYFSLTWTECDGLVDTDDCDYDYPYNDFTHMKVYTTSALGTTVTVQFSALAR